MKYYIEVKTKMHLEHIEGEKTSTFLSSHVHLVIPRMLDKSMYFNSDKLPNADGCKAVSATLTAALSNIIHYAHEKGYRDSAEHLRYVISKLEEAFVQVPTISKGDYDEKIKE